jgi:tetratricopeptide (TPR) repeat protein
MPFGNSRKSPRRKKRLKKDYAESKQTHRKKKLDQDRLKLAKHYEKLKLFDESIKYYKLLEQEDEVKRVSEIKFNTYLPKAKEFEAQGSYEDAIRLYEQLNMIDEVNRIKSKMGKPPTSSEPILEGSQDDPEPDDDDLLDDFEEIDFEDEGDIEWDAPNVAISEPKFIEDESEPEKTPKETVKSKRKVFTICPYCGEELNLPKQPNFCPFCKEPFE